MCRLLYHGPFWYHIDNDTLVRYTRSSIQTPDDIIHHDKGKLSALLAMCVQKYLQKGQQCELGSYNPAQRSWRGVYWIHLVRPSVRLSVCRRHGFRSISQVCFGISISNFICILMVAIGRSLLIFSDVTFKMAAWRPYWIFWFPDPNFTLALNINFKLQRHNTYVYV